MKGEKASSETLTGSVESAKSMRASGNSPVKVAEARRDEAGSVVGAEAAGAFVGRLDARFQHARDGLAVAGLRPDGGEGVGGRVAFVGAVEDLPIAKLAASAEADAAGADAAQREGDGGEVPSGEDAGVTRFRGRRAVRRGRGRGWGLRGGLWVAALARVTCLRKVRRLVDIRYRVLSCGDGWGVGLPAGRYGSTACGGRATGSRCPDEIWGLVAEGAPIGTGE